MLYVLITLSVAANVYLVRRNFALQDLVRSKNRELNMQFMKNFKIK